jgi:membrane fusion protein, copper/silver efflux system
MSKHWRLIVVVMAALVVVAVVAFTPAADSVRARWPRNASEPSATGISIRGTAPAPPSGTPEYSEPQRGEITIDPRRQQLIGVRTAPVRRAPIVHEIRAVGLVRADETRQTEINTRIDGWIRTLYADYTGKAIRQGEPLFTLYSPELVATQNEYLLALRGHARMAQAELPTVQDHSDRLVGAARERLRRWDLSAEDIQELEQRGRANETVTFRSPASGVIVEKNAVEGMHVTAGQTLFRVADLSSVWIEADVYAQDITAIRVGQSATLMLDAFADQAIAGRATYVYPTVDEKTRTGKVRFQFANRDGRLKPGMYATVQLNARGTTGLTIPTDALLDTGTDQVVFVAQGEGRFEPRHVKAGRRTDDAVEIVEGVKEGEEVATSAAFFLDSESQLRGAIQSYASPAGSNAAQTGPTEQIDIAFRPQPDPPKTGDNTLEVVVRDAAGKPIPDATVTVTFFMAAMPTMNMPAMRNQATLPPAGGGVYRGPGQVMMAGRWDVTVDVNRGGQRLGSKQFALVAR